jgi:hypothetical protein
MKADSGRPNYVVQVSTTSVGVPPRNRPLLSWRNFGTFRQSANSMRFGTGATRRRRVLPSRQPPGRDKTPGFWSSESCFSRWSKDPIAPDPTASPPSCAVPQGKFCAAWDNPLNRNPPFADRPNGTDSQAANQRMPRAISTKPKNHRTPEPIVANRRQGFRRNVAFPPGLPPVAGPPPPEIAWIP